MKNQIIILPIILFTLFSCGEKSEDGNTQDNTAPEVLINFPLDDSYVADTVSVRCDSTSDLDINRFVLWVDGDSVVSLSTPPYIFPWITNDYENGSHSLVLKAYDNSENQSESNTITVNVNNFLVFSNAYGEENIHEEGLAMIQTMDSNFVLLGNTADDLFLSKKDRFGNEIWSQYFGGSLVDNIRYIRQTVDGGYLLSGSSNSYGSGGSDIWVIKAYPSGLIEWNKNYGTSNNEYGGKALENNDGTLFLIGNGDMSDSGDQDIWLIKTNSQGDTLWSKTYGGTGDETGHDIISLGDSSYVILGSTSSYGNGGADIFLIKIKEDGTEEWSLNYGGTSDEFGQSILQTSDDGFVILSSIEPFGDDNNAVNVIRISSSGEVIWEKTFGSGDGVRGSNTIQNTNDDNFILTYNSFDHLKDGYNTWLVKINDSGYIEWGRTFINEDSDFGHSCVQTLDGGYAITGSTFNLGNGNKDFGDLWLLKTDERGVVALPSN